MSSRAVADIVRNEHPQLIAVVLAHLESKQGGEILALLPPATHAEVVRRVANLSDLQQSALAELDELVEKRSTDKPESRPARLSGLKKAAEMLNQMGAGRDTEILEQLSAQDQELGSRIRELMFVFENLLELDDRSVQALMREISSDVLVVALKGADADVRDKLMRNMSQRAAEILKDDIDARGPVRLSEVESAQKEILATVQRLAEEGKVMLSRGGEQFV
jgi:flagellar motor switch protein FliG